MNKLPEICVLRAYLSLGIESFLRGFAKSRTHQTGHFNRGSKELVWISLFVGWLKFSPSILRRHWKHPQTESILRRPRRNVQISRRGGWSAGTLLWPTFVIHRTPHSYQLNRTDCSVDWDPLGRKWKVSLEIYLLSLPFYKFLPVDHDSDSRKI